MKTLLILLMMPLLAFAQSTDEVSYCDKIAETSDKFSKEKNFETSWIIGSDHQIKGVILKSITASKTIRYYLSLYAIGLTAVVDGKGLTVLFDDGSKWTKSNAEIDVEVNSWGKGYDYHAFVEVSKADIVKFSTKRITDYKMDIFTNSFTEEEGEKLRIQVGCLIDKK